MTGLSEHWCQEGKVQLEHWHGWHGTVVLYCFTPHIHDLLWLFGLKDFLFVSPPAHTKMFRILGEKRLCGATDVTMGQTETPRREEWSVSFFSR